MLTAEIVKRIGIVGLLCVVACLAQAQTTPIFRMDCGVNGSNWPLCGFDVYDTSATQYYRRTRIAGGSPSGSDAVQFDFTPTTDRNLDFGYGWALTRASALPPVPQGQARYIRWRLKINSPVRWMTGSDSRWASKIVILGNNCENSTHQPTRVIQMLRGPGGSVWDRAILNSSQNIDTDGNSEAGPLSPVPVDRWVSIQLKVQSSSTTSTADGYLASYYDNNDESSPTFRSRQNFVLKTSGWSPSTCDSSWMAFGSSSREVMAGANLSFQVADFEYDDAFDPNWNRGAGPPQPPPPPPVPVNCVVSSWTQGPLVPGTCPASGEQSRTDTRTIVTPAANGGTACPALTQTTSLTCMPTLPPPVDGCTDPATAVVYEPGSGPAWQQIANHATAATRIRALNAAGFDVRVTSLASYTRLLATCAG